MNGEKTGALTDAALRAVADAIIKASAAETDPAKLLILSQAAAALVEADKLVSGRDIVQEGFEPGQYLRFGKGKSRDGQSVAQAVLSTIRDKHGV